MPKNADIYLDMSGKQLFYKIVGEISRAILTGDRIICEGDPMNLRWIWKNTRTQHKWFIRTYDIFQMLDEGLHKDIIFDFIQGKNSALETKVLMDRYEQMKAFW
jgi:hypothetical protein